MKEIQGKLDQFAGQVTGSRDLWPEIERRLRKGTPLASRRAISSLRWVAVTASLLVLASTAAYAAGPILQSVYRINPNWNPAAADSSHQVNLSQTVDGCTVTVDQVFVDSERILIGGNTDGPEEMSLSPTKLKLVTDDGVDLPFVDGAGDAREDGTSAWVWAFDATAMEPLPSQPSLRLSFQLNGIPREKAPPPTAEPAEKSGDGSALVVELSPLESSVYGPFVFTFTVPVSDSPSP
jgi:hypothetical protein